MNRSTTVLCIVAVLLMLCGTADASMVTVFRGEVPDGILSQKSTAWGPIVLTFGDERVVVHEQPLGIGGGVLAHDRVSRDKLFIVRDRRAVSKGQGYQVLYSYKGFHLASVENHSELSRAKSLMLRPVTRSMAVVEKGDSLKATPDAAIEKVLDLLDPTSYGIYLSSLSVDLGSRYLCSPEILSARDIIAQHFKELGLETHVVKFSSSCWPKRCDSPQGYNIIGIKRGTVYPNAFSLVGAHYDSVNENVPCGSAPGANDNGSGMAGVMELARVFAQLDTRRSVVFAAFSGEEQGLLGSRAFVKSMFGTSPIGKLGAKNLRSFIVLDMVSYYKNNYGVLVEGSNARSIQKTAVNKLMQLGTTYTDLIMEKTFDYGGSDHQPFLNRGLPGALLIESDWDSYAYYHTGRDRNEFQDIPFAMDVLRLSAAMLATECR